MKTRADAREQLQDRWINIRWTPSDGEWKRILRCLGAQVTLILRD